jgi:16S rRNA (guanine527-N7)-methyltransferase
LRGVLARFGAPPDAAEPIERLLELQAVDPTASTTVRDPAEALDRHVADSLVALELPQVRAARAIADLGSGAGWPGLALAAALPSARVVLVESASRHCRYLARTITHAGLHNVDVVHARAEEWHDGIEGHDLVTARALAPLPVVVEYAAPLLSVGGHLVAWKGTVLPDEAADGEAAAQATGLAVVEARPVQPFDDARGRSLHVFRKVRPTPATFPRRAGVARKRPLAAGA